MNSFRTIKQVEEYLHDTMSAVGVYTGKDVTVERMWPLLEALDNPQEKLRVIHVAGTSGKTSTSYFISALLHETSVKVGLTVSPHVQSLTERLQIDGQSISDEVFCGLFSEAVRLLGDTAKGASYFEIMIAFVLWAFVELEVEYAVIETGLGGLFDGTNVCRRADKVCVITDIGYDHQKVLGNTLSEIALQKAGIIHNGNQAFMFEQSEEIMKEVSKRVNVVRAKLYVLDDDVKWHGAESAPNFQKRNWTLAKIVYDYVEKRDNLKSLSEESIKKTQDLQVPGRMQTIECRDKIFVLDGAHNPQKMEAFVSSFQARYPRLKVPVLLSMKYDKDFAKVIDKLEQIACKFIITSFTAHQDISITSVNPADLENYIKNNYSVSVKTVTPLAEALNELSISEGDLLVVVGSLYAIGEILELLKVAHK